MKQIPLRNRKGETVAYAKVDDEDYDYLMQWRWHLSNKDNSTLYAKRGTRTTISMHREIMKVTNPQILVDHIDHDGLNCQKNNLRLTNRSGNATNRRSKRNATSKYLGVHLQTSKYKLKSGEEKTCFAWIASIRKNGKLTSIGYFDSEEDAAKAYDKKAKELHGEWANLNFK
jgi:hypothetical protein